MFGFAVGKKFGTADGMVLKGVNVIKLGKILGFDSVKTDGKELGIELGINNRAAEQSSVG